jgi:hypothetical protein
LHPGICGEYTIPPLSSTMVISPLSLSSRTCIPITHTTNATFGSWGHQSAQLAIGPGM